MLTIEWYYGMDSSEHLVLQGSVSVQKNGGRAMTGRGQRWMGGWSSVWGNGRWRRRRCVLSEISRRQSVTKCNITAVLVPWFSFALSGVTVRQHSRGCLRLRAVFGAESCIIRVVDVTAGLIFEPSFPSIPVLHQRVVQSREQDPGPLSTPPDPTAVLHTDSLSAAGGFWICGSRAVTRYKFRAWFRSSLREMFVHVRVQCQRNTEASDSGSSSLDHILGCFFYHYSVAYYCQLCNSVL